MTKPIIAIAAAVAVLTMAGPSMADFVDDFEGYVAGNDVGGPWVATASSGLGVGTVTNDGDGFPEGGTTNGVYNADFTWREMEAPTGYADDTAFIYSVKIRKDSAANGYNNGRVGPDVSDGSSTYFYWENNPDTSITQIHWYFEQNGHPGQHEGSINIVLDTWYELIMTASPAGGGVGDGVDWNVGLQHRKWNGTSFDALVTDLAANTLWDEPTAAFPFSAAEVRLDAYGNVSGTAVDDISVSAIPEPSTFGLLALGLVGLLVWRRRRQK